MHPLLTCGDSLLPNAENAGALAGRYTAAWSPGFTVVFLPPPSPAGLGTVGGGEGEDPAAVPEELAARPGRGHAHRTAYGDDTAGGGLVSHMGIQKGFIGKAVFEQGLEGEKHLHVLGGQARNHQGDRLGQYIGASKPR